MNAVWENIDTFLDTDDFSIQATLRLQSGQTRQVRAIFDHLIGPPRRYHEGELRKAAFD